ncbi:recombination protein NinB [Stutzerimonas nitrititolerans]|uniref:recombination protein NinB n=1 Tax=Stutzerimonas nitrititolerans TaxID=2482751 RepID=UPI00289910BC|nr:recombination protein NinB [Stutzerimonas nitrititolerans]
MANPTFPLRNEMDRQRAIACIQKVDLDAGYVWTMREQARSDAQNRRLWAMLRDISRQVEWYGRKLDEESWKHVFSAAVQQQDAVPGINGGFVVLGVSTRKQSKKWFNDLFEVMEAFAVEHGVRFTTADHWGIGAAA